MATTNDLATRLHAAKCMSISWSQDCQRPDGGDHAKRWRPVAKEILEAADPVVVLHSHICDAEIDTSMAGCPNLAEHLVHLREHARLPLVLTTVLRAPERQEHLPLAA